jgi:hypothetical protein
MAPFGAMRAFPLSVKNQSKNPTMRKLIMAGAAVAFMATSALAAYSNTVASLAARQKSLPWVERDGEALSR